MQGFPMPRVTTAAWLVSPPLLVRMPFDRCMPLMSSGDVSFLTRMHGMPCSKSSSTFWAVSAMCPVAAPGDAGSPFPMGLMSCSFLKLGCSMWSSAEGSIVLMASLMLMMPSMMKSLAILIAACGARLPFLVWSM